MSDTIPLPSSSSEREQQSLFSHKKAPPPRKTSAHRFCTYLVLWSFLFQTIWPSVVWAEGLLHETVSSHNGIKHHYLSFGVHIDDTRVDDKLEAERGETFHQHKARYIQVAFDQGLENLRAEVQSSLDIQSLYPGLQATEKGLSWSSSGVSFFMSYQGMLLVSGLGSIEEQRKSPILRLFNPHGDIILGDGLQVPHIQVRAKDVHQQGNSVIERLEVWAQGGLLTEDERKRTPESGQFKVTKSSTLTTQYLTLHQGVITNQGMLSVLAGGIVDGQGNTVTNEGILAVGTGVTIRNVSDFQNDGTVKGKGLTLDQTIGTNSDTLTLDDLATQGGVFYNNGKVTLKRWRQGGETFVNASGSTVTVSEHSTFDATNMKSKGTLILAGESLGKIDSFTNEGSLTMGSVSGLRVQDFSSTGDFEVTGPMTWSGTRFKSAKTTFKGKTSITAAVMETAGDLTSEFDLSLVGNWIHKSGTARIASLLLKGQSFKNEHGASLTVTGSSDVDTDSIDNGGTINWEGMVTGHVGDFLNNGDVTLRGDAKLTGLRLLNGNTFKALGIFDWVGETLTNTAIGRMTLFDNQVSATRQVINQGLLLWTHNTFRTWHFLNIGWAEMTQDLEAVLPTTWKAPQDTSMTFKKSMVENRGTLKIAPKGYTPRMTIEHSGDFAHWSNSGKMQLPDAHLQAQNFTNTGDLVVEGALSGHVDTFENSKKAVFRGTVNLTGKTFSTTGAMILVRDITLKMESLLTGGQFTTQAGLTLDGVDWTNREGSKADIASLLFKGKSIANDGQILIRELLGSRASKVIALLRNGHTNSPKDEKRRPLFRILKGGASFTKVTNWGALALGSGQYRFQDLTNPGIIEADAFLPEGTETFRLQGTIHAKSFCSSVFRGTKIINSGKTTFDSTSFRTPLFENEYGAILTLFGYGTADIGALDNWGTISLNETAAINVDTLMGSSGTLESSDGTLRFLMLDSSQSAQSSSFHPTAKVRKGGTSLDTGTLKAKGDLILEIAASLNLAAYLLFYGDKWQCRGILRLYGETFLAKWDTTIQGPPISW